MLARMTSGSGINADGLLIFDCDGVLVDSERIAVRIDARVLAALGWHLTEAEIVERFMGRSQQYMVGEIESHLGRPLPPEWEDEFLDLYRVAFEAELRPVDGIVDALDRIRVPTCVASSGSHAKIEGSLRLTGLWDRFEGRIFSRDDVARGKPAPDLFLFAASTMGIEPARAVVVEDSPYGIEAAIAAGMPALGYAGGLVPPERLAGATRVFTDMRDLPTLLEGLGLFGPGCGVA
jgi:HAD superfamily hydrolase (TIGR01509 family)